MSGSAYSAQRIYLALGFTIGFIIAEFVSVQGTVCLPGPTVYDIAGFLSVQGRVWFMLGAVLVALIADIIIEVKTQKFRFLHRVKNIPDSNQKSSDANDTVCTSSDSKNIDEGGQFDAVNAAFRRCSVVTIDVQEVQGKDSFTS